MCKGSYLVRHLQPLKGLQQNGVLKRGLERELQVLEQYSKPFMSMFYPVALFYILMPLTLVPVLTLNFLTHTSPSFGLAEVKCLNISNISEAGHIQMCEWSDKTHKKP